MIKINKIEIPQLEYLFNSGYFVNIYTGSKDGFNYKIVPNRDKKEIEVFIWEGKFCCEKSEIKSKQVFILSEEGHKDMVSFIEKELNEYEKK